jgi:hypothetical protein
VAPQPRAYGNLLTADVNQKGVLDVDTVKGCTSGMSARPGTGCYGGCYAAKIAKFRGIDFAQHVTRTVETHAQARAIERAVQNAPNGFFRIGTMGDPSHAWEHTVEIVEWLSAFAVPVIVTKHWRSASDDQLRRLMACRAALNTSISAIDTPAELAYRKRQLYRFRLMGGNSVARVVSCKFNRDHPDGARMGRIQDRLFAHRPLIDNPLRVPANHSLVTAGIISVSRRLDINSEVFISVENDNAYTGTCNGCSDLCGITKER